MGYWKDLGKSAGTGLIGSLTGGIGGAIGQGINELFGFDRRAMKRQTEQQKELMDYQLSQSYLWNEKAAENAFARDMQMYERNYKDQSYSAMRKQMEEAGLSVGLMYGGGGASGGGGGATSGAPQGGVAGGTPQATDAAALQANRIREMQLGLQAQDIQATIELKKAQANEANEKANEAKENAKSIKDQLPHIVKGLFQKNLGEWIDNLRKRFDDANEWYFNESKLDAKDNYFGEYTILMKGIRSTQEVSEITKTIAEESEAESKAAWNWMEAIYTNEKTKGYATELQVAIMHGNADMIRAMGEKLIADTKAQELAYHYGVELTPKFIIDYSVDLIRALAGAIGGAYGVKMATKVLTKGAAKGAASTISKEARNARKYGPSAKEAKDQFDPRDQEWQHALEESIRRDGDVWMSGE